MCCVWRSILGLALDTQDWDAVAKKDHLSDMATELRRLEGTIREIHQEMVQMRSREEEMRNINGQPTQCYALKCFSVVGTGVLVGVNILAALCRRGARNHRSNAVSSYEQWGLVAEATNARIAWFSIGSLVMCVSLAAWQLIYLRRFFR